MPGTNKHNQPLRTSARTGGARPRKTDPNGVARLLEEWMRGDQAEQRRTFETLRQSLDEDRPAGYKLFS